MNKSFCQTNSYPHLKSLLKGFQQALFVVSGATILFFGLVGSASASTLYSQQSDDSGSISTSVIGTVLGSFTTGSSGAVMNSSSVAQVTAKNNSGYCSGSNYALDLYTNSSYPYGSAVAYTDMYSLSSSYTTQVVNFNSFSSNLSANTTYYIVSYSNCNFVSGVYYEADVTNTDFYGYVTDSGGYIPPNESNFLIPISPSNGSTTISDPVTLSYQYYYASSTGTLPPTDLIVTLKEYYPSSTTTVFDFPTSVEDNIVTVSTSTELDYNGNGGAYQMEASLINSPSACSDPLISWYCDLFLGGGQTTLLSISPSTFYVFNNPFPEVSTSTGLSEACFLGLCPSSSSTTLFGAGVSGATSTISACQSLTLNIADPTSYGQFLTTLAACLFVPDPNQTQLLYQGADNSLLSRQPWGYITLVAQDISTTSTTSLPVLSISLPPNNVLNSTSSLTLDPWIYMFGAGSLMGDATTSLVGSSTGSVTAVQVILPVEEDILYLSFALYLFFRLLNYFTGQSGNNFSTSFDSFDGIDFQDYTREKGLSVRRNQRWGSFKKRKQK